jgi:hypothetical protein
MIHLTQGDRFPMVAVVQTLLNAWNLHGDTLEVDGAFGSLTHQKVIHFQRQNNIPQSGIVRQRTWNKLIEVHRLDVRDLVDISDPELYYSSSFLRNIGATPLEIGRLSNATAGIATRVWSSGIQSGRLVLLRFHGHGKAGAQVVGYGTGCHVIYETFRQSQTMPPMRECTPQIIHPTDIENTVQSTTSLYSGLSNRSLDVPGIVNSLRPLSGFFSPYGSIEFHGCHIGDGEAGNRFLRRISDLLGVPASGAHNSQHTYNAVRYSGPVEIAYPNSGNLTSWARQLLPIINS